MKNLKELSLLDERELIELGAFATIKEITQQPEVWKKTFSMISDNKERIESFLEKCGINDLSTELSIYLTGAGSSEFAGNAAAPYLQKCWQRQVISVPTTDFITHTDYFIMKNKKNLVVSIGRSGNSPESIATFHKAKEFDPDVKQINICCNKESKMAALSKNDGNTLNLILPDETNDDSLVMTSSYTSMVLTLLTLPHMADLGAIAPSINLAASGADRIINTYSDLIQDFISYKTERILYLGTAELKGCAQESRLKSQEMTDGKILSDFNSYLGLRHGPQVFANKTSLIIAYLSTDSTRRKYETDLLLEMQEKKQGYDYLLVCSRTCKDMKNIKGKIIEVFPEGYAPEDAFNILPFVVTGQLNGLFKSLQIGHKPDSPSVSGTINRVVQGVAIY